MKSMGHPVRKNRMWYRQKIKKIFFSQEKNFKKNIFEITGEISGHRPDARIVLTIVSSSIRIQPYPQKQNRL